MILVSVPTRTCHYVHNISNGLTARPVADVPQYPTLVTGGLPVTDNHFLPLLINVFVVVVMCCGILLSRMAVIYRQEIK